MSDQLQLLTDPWCGLTDAQLQAHAVHLLPLSMHEGRLPAVELRQTAALLSSLCENGPVLYLSASQALCSSGALVSMLAQERQLPVTTIDTGTISAGLGQLVLLAAESIRAGKTVSELEKILPSARAGQLFCFVPAKTAALRRTGRVPAMMQLKGKTLYLNSDGAVEMLTGGGSFEKAVDAMCEEIFRRCAGQPVRITVFGYGSSPQAADVARRLQETVKPVAIERIPVEECLLDVLDEGLIGVSVLPERRW